MLLADGLTWNVASDLRQLFEFHFMVNAFRAGTIVAVVAALIGWYVVLRHQSFVAHTLAVVSFPGVPSVVTGSQNTVSGVFTLHVGDFREGQ